MKKKKTHVKKCTLYPIKYDLEDAIVDESVNSNKLHRSIREHKLFGRAGLFEGGNCVMASLFKAGEFLITLTNNVETVTGQ